MKRVFLLMVVSALLATLGFAQTPDTGSNTDLANLKGCLGGSDGNYTIAENGTRQIFKITTSTVDLKAHVWHEVKLIGHKTSGAASSGAGDNSFSVTELSMISEHCAAAAAAPIVTVIPPSETVISPDAAAAAPSATASAPAADPAAPAAAITTSAATPVTPAVDPAATAAAITPSAATPVTPAVDTAAPAATAPPSAAVVDTPAVEAVQAPRPSAHARKLAATKAAAARELAEPVNPSMEPASPPPADAATTPDATATPVSPSAETVTVPDAAVPATAPPAVTHNASTLPLLIAFVVLVIVLGTTAPLIGRWRKRKMLQRDGSPNLSFTNEVTTNESSPGRDKPEPRKVA